MTKNTLTYALSCAFLFCGTTAIQAASYPANVEVFFSPKGGAEEAIVKAINHAKRHVYVEAFLFTNPAITNALLEAHQRGVDVKVVMDRKAALTRKTSLSTLAKQSVPTYLDGKHSTAHNKVILIDDNKVLTGSFNFIIRSETSNAENLLVINSEKLANRYRKDWEDHLGHSKAVDYNTLMDLKAKRKEESK